VVDDRTDPGDPAILLDEPVDPPPRILESGGRGPAAARNTGWRAGDATWVVFLDDDVEVGRTWLRDLERDLAVSGATVAVQGRIAVPLPSHRAPTDWERSVAGLQGARWITADLAVRRTALERVGGFDERFPRAYREDTDLALRLQRAGGNLLVGRRSTRHPVGAETRGRSLRRQVGNRDDALMRRLHGPRWRADGGAPPGRLGVHAATTFVGLVAVGALGLGRRRPAALAGGAWALATAQLAWARIGPGPRDRREVAEMIRTSIALPPVAVLHRLAGEVRARRMVMPSGG
jgi:hypothetical protein